MGVPQKIWFIMENLMKMDDEQGSPISGNLHMVSHAICPNFSSALRAESRIEEASEQALARCVGQK